MTTQLPRDPTAALKEQPPVHHYVCAGAVRCIENSIVTGIVACSSFGWRFALSVVCFLRFASHLRAATGEARLFRPRVPEGK